MQEFPEGTGNLVMVNEMPEMHPHASLEEIQLDQTVMRFDYYKSVHTDMAFNFISKGEFEDESGTMIQDSRYMVITYDREGGRVELRRHYQPFSELSVWQARFRFAPQEWHQVEISRYDGRLELWVDGALVASYEDPQPLTPGGFNFEIFESTAPDAKPTFDNIAICNLNAPFTPAPMATPAAE